MSSSYYGYWLIAFGVGITALMITVNGLTSNTTQDYLSSREITESAMLDSIDYGYYRDFNEVKMNKEKFMEVFTRRLSEAQGNETYQLNFYEMYETPPKVSVEIVNENAASNSATQSTYDVTTRVDAILQMFSLKDLNITGGTTDDPTNPTNPVDPSQQTTPTDPNLPINPNTPSNPNPVNPDIINQDPNIPDDIKAEELNAELFGKHGLALVPGNTFPSLASAFTTLQGAKTGTGIKVGEQLSTTQSADPIIFTIIGETQDGWYWVIKFTDSSGEHYGWVRNEYMAINLREYLPSNVTFNITNANGSIFKVKGQDIPNVTGQKLYNNNFNQFVPLDYHYAQKIKTIAESLTNDYGFIIYDAYRPQSVGQYVNSNVVNKFGAYTGQNGYYKNGQPITDGMPGCTGSSNVNGYCGYTLYTEYGSTGTVWGQKQRKWADEHITCKTSKENAFYQCYIDGDNEMDDDYMVAVSFFIAGGASNHNYGCAVDIALTQYGKKLDSYSPMHELSGDSMKYDLRTYYYGGNGHSKGYKEYSQYYNSNTAARILNETMMSQNNNGYQITDIPSEWWHYNDSACLNRRTTNGKEDERYAMSFWSNV